MNTNTKFAVLMTAALTLAGLGLAPSTTADMCEPASDTCQHAEGTGFGGLHVWGFLLAGGAACTDEIPTGDAACQVGSGGTIKSAGGMFFSTAHWNPGSGFHARHATINVEYIDGSGVELDGFVIDVCSDRNDNSFCGDFDAETGEDIDQGITAFANDDHETDGCKKDSKGDTCNDLTAETPFCVSRDLPFRDPPLNLDPDGEWDDVVVFIMAWIKESATGLTGSNEEVLDWGASIGTFEGSMEDGDYLDDTESCPVQDSFWYVQ